MSLMLLRGAFIYVSDSQVFRGYFGNMSLKGESYNHDCYISNATQIAIHIDVLLPITANLFQ